MKLDDLIAAPGVLPDDPGANRVLVVDDDLSQRMLMVRILRRAGYECSTAMSTEEARGHLSREHFGLVITDMRMFAEDGIELVRYVADSYPDTYSIVVSGFVPEEDAERIQRAGAFQFLTKPFEKESFVATIESAFDHRQATMAERRHRSA